MRYTVVGLIHPTSHEPLVAAVLRGEQHCLDTGRYSGGCKRYAAYIDALTPQEAEELTLRLSGAWPRPAPGPEDKGPIASSGASSTGLLTRLGAWSPRSWGCFHRIGMREDE